MWKKINIYNIIEIKTLRCIMKIEQLIKKLNIKKYTTTAILSSNDSISKYIENEFKNSLLITSIPKDNIELLVNDMTKLIKDLKIAELFEYSFNTLSIGQKQLLQIVCALGSKNKTIILDNALSNISDTKKEIIYKYIKTTDKTVINITKNTEDIIYSEYTIVLKDDEVLLNNKTNEILDRENEFKESGFELPFMALLSLKLKYYNLVKKPITSMDRMVNKLWK
jgi:energy-coupling factor transporter ATP-binding protein EcfA2